MPRFIFILIPIFVLATIALIITVSLGFELTKELLILKATFISLGILMTWIITRKMRHDRTDLPTHASLDHDKKEFVAYPEPKDNEEDLVAYEVEIKPQQPAYVPIIIIGVIFFGIIGFALWASSLISAETIIVVTLGGTILLLIAEMTFIGAPSSEKFRE